MSQEERWSRAIQNDCLINREKKYLLPFIFPPAVTIANIEMNIYFEKKWHFPAGLERLNERDPIIYHFKIQL